MMKKCELGRSSHLSELEVGDVFLQQSSSGAKLIICASDSSKAQDAKTIFAYADSTPVLRLVETRTSSIGTVSGWVLPKDFKIIPEFASLTTEILHNQNVCSNLLFLAKDGEILIPIMSPNSQFQDPIGWLGMSDFKYRSTPERFLENLCCFLRWGIHIKIGDEYVPVWMNKTE